MNEGLKHALRAEAQAAGFVAMGICRPDAIPQAAPRLNSFVEAGWHGQMAWMAERMGWRGHPDALWPEARSVIMLAEAYTPEHDPLEILARPDRGAISVYAQGRDYHDIVKKRLKRVGRWLIAQEPEAEIKVFVDTAPVMEKPLAEAAGLGWQGKHTNLLGREIGNWVFLGSIFTSVELPVDAPAQEHCGNCTACLDICPTNAFPAPYPAGCAAVHLLPDDRAQGPGARRVSRRAGQPDLWLRRLSRGLSLEQVRRFGARHAVPAGRRRAAAGGPRGAG